MIQVVEREIFSFRPLLFHSLKKTIMDTNKPIIVPHIQEDNMNYLGFEKSKVRETVKNLNHLLANYHLYYQNLRNFHWNIQGENFFDLHAKFEDLYNDARLKIDQIAERVLTLRHKPMSTLSDYLEYARIEEVKETLNDRDMVLALLGNHQVLIEDFRKILESASEAGDEGTVDMVGSFLENMEKSSWMLDAWASKSIVSDNVW